MFTHVLVKNKNLQRAVRQRQKEIPDKQLRIMKVRGRKKKKENREMLMVTELNHITLKYY